MNIYDATELAYKNGHEAGRNSVANQCVMCGAPLPDECNSMVCAQCKQNYGDSPVHIVGKVIKPPPKPNTELSFGANDGQYDFLVCYRRAKPLNRFQIWMYKVCFGIRARNI